MFCLRIFTFDYHAYYHYFSQSFALFVTFRSLIYPPFHTILFFTLLLSLLLKLLLSPLEFRFSLFDVLFTSLVILFYVFISSIP